MSLPNSRRRFVNLVYLTAMACLLPIAGCVSISSLHHAKEHRSLSATYVPGETLTVNTRNGSVTILVEPTRTDISIETDVRTGGSTIQEAEDRLSTVHIAADHSKAKVLTVTANFTGGTRSGDGCSFVITTPGLNGLNVTTSNGSVDITKTNGIATLRTSNGSITITDHDGSADVHTSNSRIQAQNVTGDITGGSSNGKIILENVKGTANLSTSNSSIHLKTAPDSEAPFILSTSNSSVTLEITPNMIGSIEARTSNGSIKTSGTENRQTLVSLGDTGSKKYRKIVLTENGPHSTIKTSNGSVKIIFLP